MLFRSNPLRPAGLYLVALAGPGETHVTRHRFAGDRGAVRRQAAAAALDLLLAYLEETR